MLEAIVGKKDVKEEIIKYKKFLYEDVNFMRVNYYILQ